MKIIQFVLLIFSLKSSFGDDLQCNYVSHYDGYNCEMESKYDQRAEVTAVKGYHKYGKVNSDIQVFFVNAASTTQYIPSKVCSYMKNLNKLDIFGKKIVELKYEAFKGCINVKKLMIRHLDVKTLDAILLSDLIRLESFTLEQTSIEILPANFFQYNNKLKEVNMPNNKLKVIQAKFPATMTTLMLSNNLCIDMSYNPMSYRSSGSLNLTINEVDKKCKNASTTGETETPEQLRLKDLEDKIIEYSEKFLLLETKIESDVKDVGNTIRSFQFNVTSSEQTLGVMRNSRLTTNIQNAKTNSEAMESTIKTHQTKSNEIRERIKKSEELKTENENLKSSISSNKHLITIMLTFQSLILAYILCVVSYGKFILAKDSKGSALPKSNGSSNVRTNRGRPEMTEYLIADDDDN
jgi:hypothetical protein